MATAVSVGLSLSVVLALRGDTNGVGGLITFGVVFGVVAANLFGAAYFLLRSFASLWDRSSYRLTAGKYPSVVFVRWVMTAMTMLDSRRSQRDIYRTWSDDALVALNAAASVLDHDLPSMHGRRASSIVEGIGQDLDLVARKTRAVGVAAVTGGPLSPSALHDELRRVIAPAIEGNWRALKSMNIVPLNEGKKSASTRHWIRSLLASILPIAVVAALSLLLDLPSSIIAYGWLVTSVWAVLSLVLLLDPRFGERLELLSGAPELLNRESWVRKDGQ